MLDNLSIEQAERLTSDLKDKMPTQGFFILCLQQLSDTIRENERLREALSSIARGMDKRGLKIDFFQDVAITALELLRNKDSDNA